MGEFAKQVETRAAEVLALPAGRLPVEEMPRFKKYLKDEFGRLKKMHREGGLGREMSRAHAAVIDELLRHLLDAVLATVKGPRPPLALVATGGYGRGELSPHSDIDIQFLHDGKQMARGGRPTPFLQSITDGVLYPLWDLGLKVGHAVRGVDDCVEVANADVMSKTSLLEARLVCGDAPLFERMVKAVRDKAVRGREEQYITARLEDQARRREKHGGAVTMQEPNIKNGCGGLRDYQNLIWMMAVRHGYKSVADLEREKIISRAEAERLESAYSFLLRARNELHYQCDRPVEVLSKAVQPKVAWQLGYTNRSPSLRLEAFLGDYYRHARNIDLIVRAVERRLALVPKSPWKTTLRKLVGRRSEQVVDGFKVIEGEILHAGDSVFDEDPRRLMRVFLLAQRHGLTLHPDLSQLLRQQTWRVNRAFRSDAHVHQTFLEILNQRGNVGRVLRQMHELELLGRYLPEFGRLTCLVQHEFYHQYTVDEHTLVCIEKLDALYSQTLNAWRQYREVFNQVERPFILYLALLLHDSGKGIQTDRHEREGARVAEHVADRLGLDETAAKSLDVVIRQHLAMVQVAQRRDLEDAQVIRQFVELVQTPENLTLLTLHTVADSLGTSDQLWNGFKDAAHWTLFVKSQQLLAGTSAGQIAEQTSRDEIEQRVAKLLDAEIDADERAAHLQNLPARYLHSSTPEDIAQDMALVHQFLRAQVQHEDQLLKPVIAWEMEPDRGCAQVRISTWDRPRLFSKITGAFSEAGLNILSAQVFTRADSVVLDRFHVTDARRGHLPVPAQLKQFETRLAEILCGTDEFALDVSRLPVPTLAYPVLADERIPIEVRFDNHASAEFSVVDIQAEDRVGLLYVISHTLGELGLDIQLAKINTEKGAATDSFYILGSSGGKVTDKNRQKEITARLRAAIEALYPA